MLVTTTEMYLRVFSQKQVVADFLRDILPAQADCRFDADSAWCDEHLSRALLSKNQHFRVDLPNDASLPEIMEHLSALSRGRAALGQTIQPQSRPATNAGEDPLS